MKWVGHVACIRDSRGAKRFWWEHLRERAHLEDERTILKWIFMK